MEIAAAQETRRKFQISQDLKTILRHVELLFSKFNLAFNYKVDDDGSGNSDGPKSRTSALIKKQEEDINSIIALLYQVLDSFDFVILHPDPIVLII